MLLYLACGEDIQHMSEVNRILMLHLQFSFKDICKNPLTAMFPLQHFENSNLSQINQSLLDAKLGQNLCAFIHHHDIILFSTLSCLSASSTKTLLCYVFSLNICCSHESTLL